LILLIDHDHLLGNNTYTKRLFKVKKKGELNLGMLQNASAMPLKLSEIGMEEMGFFSVNYSPPLIKIPYSPYIL